MHVTCSCLPVPCVLSPACLSWIVSCLTAKMRREAAHAARWGRLAHSAFLLYVKSLSVVDCRVTELNRVTEQLVGAGRQGPTGSVCSCADCDSCLSAVPCCAVPCCAVCRACRDKRMREMAAAMAVGGSGAMDPAEAAAVAATPVDSGERNLGTTQLTSACEVGLGYGFAEVVSCESLRRLTAYRCLERTQLVAMLRHQGMLLPASCQHGCHMYQVLDGCCVTACVCR
jgi:hypothetical protein